MIKAIITINLTLTGPILTQSSSPSAWGLDMVAARNTEGYFYLPGTLVVGKLRQAWQELEAAVRDEQNWFTPEFAKWLGEANENDIPNTKQLYFSDLVYQGDEDSNAVLNRIEIDEERGAVAENQLVVIQSPFLTGDDYLFTGELHFFANNHEEVNKIVRHVEAGLHWTAQLGAMRTVGFGRVKSVTCSTITKELSKPDLPAQLPAVKNFTLIIRPLYPFCITDKPVADNLFESIYIIPGSVILGSIVTTWNHLCKKSGGRTDDINDEQRTKLKDYFSSIRISHALPSEEVGTRPISLPLSLVKVPKDDDLYDVILLDKPCLINGETPAFAIDWKEDANSDYGWPQITKELRTRTHIDPETLRSADKDLFSYEQIAPKSLNWNAVIDLSRISENDRNAVFSELQSLLSEGIAALSKTKTPASIEWSELPIKATRASDTKPINGKQWIITLQTDTLLGAPITLNENSGLENLQTMYETAWSELSDNKLELVPYRYFARQRLSGGNYRHHVFMAKEKLYKPWLLTEAGSVFLLQSVENVSVEDCQSLIEDWLAHGLPLKGQVLNHYGIADNEKKQWKTCPFIPQNGYGEIAVNLQFDNIMQLTPDAKQKDKPVYLF